MIDIQNWFDRRITELEKSSDPKDIRLMLELLSTRSRLKVDDKKVEQMDYNAFTDEELMRILKGENVD